MAEAPLRPASYGRASIRHYGFDVHAAWTGGPYIELFWESKRDSPEREAFEVINVWDYAAGRVDPTMLERGAVRAKLLEWLREVDRAEIANYYENTRYYR